MIKPSIGTDRTFLLFFNLPNSPISTVDEDEDEQISIFTPSTETSVDEVKIFPTFFSSLPHKFFALDRLTFEELPSELFLQTCETYFSLVGKFNSPIFSPMKSDVYGNITKLRRKINEDPKRFVSLFAMITDEIKGQTTHKKNSATDALLWLKRAFEFISCFLHQFGQADKTLAEATIRGYEQSLRRYHGFFARNILSFALRAVPNNDEFLRSLAINPLDASNPHFENQVFREILDHSGSMFAVLNTISSFYVEHGLDMSISSE